MIEDEFKNILDREYYPDMIKRHYTETINLLKEVTNYGARLIVRIFSLTKGEVKDVVVIANLLKQVVTFLDATEILVSQGAITAAALPLRSLFEVRLFVEWILDSDTDFRAKSYYVWYLRKTHSINSWGIVGSDRNSDMKKILSKSGRENVLNRAEKLNDRLIQENNAIKELLESEFYADINQSFEILKKGRKNNWYAINKGPQDLREIACKLNIEDEYVIVYSSLSKIAHGVSIEKQVVVEEDNVIFEHVRNLKGTKTILNGALNCAFSVYRKILQHYIPSELENYNRKYVEEWRDRYLNIPEVELNSSETINT